MRHRRFLVAIATLALALTLPLVVNGSVTVAPGGGTPGTSQSFELVGHSDLHARGMNAAPTLYDHYVYVGNRTDGSPQHPTPGILIIDVADPTNPTIVGEIGPPHASQIGITTRELRVWPAQKLLMVMTFRCSSQIHDCPPGTDQTFPFDIKFFDLTDPVHPQFLSSYVPTSKAGQIVKPHEMYLWIDPKNANRALLWLSTPGTSVNPNRPNLMIVDISDVPNGGSVREVAEGNWNQFFPGAADPANYDFDLALHSMAPTADGRKTNLAYLRGGFGVLDTSAVVDNVSPGAVISLNDKLLTPVRNFVRWGAGNQCAGGTAEGCSESHSAVPVPGRPFELNIDEVYGKFTASSFGWPWGWARLINVAQPRRPHIVGEYKIFQNSEAFQGSAGDDPATESFTSYSSHNPTLTRNLALVAWHSGGLQAIDISDPATSVQGGWFSPAPLAAVATEDPALSSGPNKVVMWSYPIVKNGLVYVVDIRNGLYILRYTGPRSAEVSRLRFLRGTQTSATRSGSPEAPGPRPLSTDAKRAGSIRPSSPRSYVGLHRAG